MKLYQIEKLLDDKTLSEISDILSSCNQNNLWNSGIQSVGGDSTKSNKNNLEIGDINITNNINSKVVDFLYKSPKFTRFAIPFGNYVSLVSKSQENHYYGPHLDNWANGDFSTTVFLNNTDEYEGGELCLYLGGEDEIKIKLDAGWAVTYFTGILHRVNKVTSGSRYVSVIWSKSILKDNFMRQMYYELSNIEELISNNMNDNLHITDCPSVTKDPIFCIRNLKEQILRNNSSY